MELKPVVAYLGTPPPSVLPHLATLTTKFNLLPYEAGSLTTLLKDLQDEKSQIYSAVAILRLGTQASTGIPIGWTGHIAKLPSIPPRLELLVNFGHGLEREDVKGAAERGICVQGTAGGVDSTAIVGVYLTISAFRQLSAAERAARSGDPTLFVAAMHRATDISLDPQGKSVGIIGYGRIGQRTGDFLRAIGMRVYWFSRSGPGVENQHSKVDTASREGPFYDLDTMISQVDCVLLACPYTPETHHIINMDRIQKMKYGVRIVNIARGACINEDALIHGVEAGIIHGIGLDVYETEPSLSQRLLDLDCTTFLPHVGGLSVSSVDNHWLDAIHKVAEFFNTKGSDEN